MRRISLALLVLVLPRGAVAAAPQPPLLRVALRPVEAVNVPPEVERRYRQLLEETIRSTPSLELRPGTEGELGCDLRQGSCLRSLHAALGADRLLVLRLGRLGDTVVVRLLVHDLAQGSRQGSFQEVLARGAGEREAREALRRMVAGFAPPPPPPPRATPWYGRWWVWTLAGVVITGSVVTAAVLGTRSRGDEPDKIIRLPPP